MSDRHSQDVRMRGFPSRVLVQTALDWVDSQTTPLPAEVVLLAGAHGRILAGDVVSPLDVPPFRRAAMDGYALRGAETTGASDYNPLPFRIVGSAFPGRPFLGDVPAGTAVQIMTGAPVPDQADAVLPVEFTDQSAEQMEAHASVPPGKHLGQPGEDVRAGSRLLPAGRRLRPQDVAILASVGLDAVSVVRRPRVRILTTGNELVPPGALRGAYQIFDSNSSMLTGLVARDGGEPLPPVYLADDREAIRVELVAPGADVILVSGGSSVGAEDHAPSLVAELGDLAIHGIAMRPSSPTGMGRIDQTLICLLPGNPVSCLCAYDFFAGRMLRRLAALPMHWPYQTATGVLTRKLVSAVGRLDYARVQFEQGQVQPLALSGASILSSTVRADGFVVIPEACEGYAPGTEVQVHLFDQVLR